MVKVWDIYCRRCAELWEAWLRNDEDLPDCPKCGSEDTKRFPGGLKSHKAKDPYDYLNGPIPDPKPIKSFANDRRKGGKDTT